MKQLYRLAALLPALLLLYGCAADQQYGAYLRDFYLPPACQIWNRWVCVTRKRRN